MTVKELSQLYHLRGEIEMNKRHLEELEAQKGCAPVAIDGMPHGKGPAVSRVEQLAAEIVDLEAIIHAKQIQCIHERARLERYIQEIPDSITRQIFELRFVEGRQWEEVAQEISGSLGQDRTAYAVKKRCYRYLDGSS